MFQRNPSIRIYGLPWGYPSWVGGGEWWPYRYPNRTATYIIKWIQGAKTHYNVTVDYVGVSNDQIFFVFKFLFRVVKTTLSSSYNISGLVPVCWLLFQCF